ncbi:MAG: GCN5-related N-acetyltransferase [Acidimicrobiales bacterium]|nr:GCN5-related N-acetyltransferase [Acidimicrobiales bacterium]
MEVTVRRVQPEVTFPLRHRVLRAHQTVEELRFPADGDPRSAHFGAFDADGRIVSTAVVFPEAPPWAPSAEAAFRLRGMATDEAWRGRGIGAAVLAAAVDHVAAEGGRLLWCNARLPAVSLYERAGFERVGEEWDEPYIGPHVAMELHLARVGA